jgi:hypothetical protein
LNSTSFLARSFDPLYKKAGRSATNARVASPSKPASKHFRVRMTDLPLNSGDLESYQREEYGSTEHPRAKATLRPRWQSREHSHYMLFYFFIFFTRCFW